MKPPKSTKSRNSNPSVQLQIKPKSQLEFVPRDTEKAEMLDLVDFGGVAISGGSVMHVFTFTRDTRAYTPKEIRCRGLEMIVSAGGCCCVMCLLRHAFMSTHTIYIYIYIHIYTYMCICIYTHVYICIYMCMCICIYIHVHTYIFMYIYMYIYPSIYVYI